jgi:hypothetical protein
MTMMGLLEDLRGALRAQRRVLGSTALIVVALGVGIGSSTAVFSALRVVLIPEYPFADPDRLVLIEEAVEGQPGRLTVPDVQTLVASDRWRESRPIEPATSTSRGSRSPNGSPGPT